jgi:exopolysaccharide production protein ExoQ
MSGLSGSLGRIEFLIWLAGYLVAVGWMLSRTGTFLNSIVENVWIFTWPVLACASFFWSLDPGLSLYDGIQLLMTVIIGFYLADRFKLHDFLTALFWALLAAMVLSAIMVVISSSGKTPRGEWVGVFPHKNTLGAFSVVLMLTTMVLSNKRQWLILFLSTMLLCTVLLIGSRSGTSIVTAVFVLPLFVATFLIKRNLSFFPLLAGAAIVLGTLALAAIFLLQIDTLDTVTGALGKNKSLSGRTILWDFGINAFWDRPWIGHGYKGYWACCETTAGALKLTMKQRLSSFHNNFIDVGVSFGFVGLFVFVMGLWVALRRSIVVWLRFDTAEHIWPLAFMLVLLVRCFVEYPLFENHGLYQLLLAFVTAKTLTISRLLPAQGERGV